MSPLPDALTGQHHVATGDAWERHLDSAGLPQQLFDPPSGVARRAATAPTDDRAPGRSRRERGAGRRPEATRIHSPSATPASSRSVSEEPCARTRRLRSLFPGEFPLATHGVEQDVHGKFGHLGEAGAAPATFQPEAGPAQRRQSVEVHGREAEMTSDGARCDRKAEVCDEIDGVAIGGGLVEHVELVLDDRRDHRFHARKPVRGELGSEHPSQTGGSGGSSDRGRRARGQPGDGPDPPEKVIAERRVAGEDRPRLLVTRDDPGSNPQGNRQPTDGFCASSSGSGSSPSRRTSRWTSSREGIGDDARPPAPVRARRTIHRNARPPRRCTTAEPIGTGSHGRSRLSPHCEKPARVPLPAGAAGVVRRGSWTSLGKSGSDSRAFDTMAEWALRQT